MIIFAMKNAQKYNLVYNRHEVARLQPKIRHPNAMKFKEQHKTALAKVLSDLVQCDGIVNQGEIDFLQRAYSVFRITTTSRKKATRLSLAEAVATLKTLGDEEKTAILRVLQMLSMSDDDLAQSESQFITALLLSIGLRLPETEGIKAEFVSIPNLSFDTRNAVLYVEPTYHKGINARIKGDYDAICQVMASMGREFFYLPHVVGELDRKKDTFRNTLGYLEPSLSPEQIDHIDRNLAQLNSAFFSKEIFLNHLNANGLNIQKPAFFLKIDTPMVGRGHDFLIIEIDKDPLDTIRRVAWLKANILNVDPPVSSPRETRLMAKFKADDGSAVRDELQYTGLHKIIIDTVLKYNVSQQLSRLYITRRGDIFLTDRNNTEVKMPALCKALYIFFLIHEEGVSLTYLDDHKTELYHIYRCISTYGDDDLLRKAVDNLTDYIGSTMNTNLSRIRKAFRDILGDEASIYLIKGEKGGRKIIHLDRRLVVFEDRKAFS